MTKIPHTMLAAALFLILGTHPLPLLARTSLESRVVEAALDVLRPGEVKPIPFAANTTYAVCFTPGQDCEGLIVKETRNARKTILLQAYSFTSAPIAKALTEAKQRGVDVRAILDKSQRKEKYTGATFLQNAGIPVVIDDKPAIAHSKIMIFDQQAVLTGSFNFTKSAQERNAENVILIKGDANLVRFYTDNWVSRWKRSVQL